MPVDANLSLKASAGERSGSLFGKWPSGRDLSDWASRAAILYGIFATLCFLALQDLSVFAGWYGFDYDSYRSSGSIFVVVLATLILLGAGLNLLLFVGAAGLVRVGSLQQDSYRLFFTFLGIATSCIVLAAIGLLTLSSDPLFSVLIALGPMVAVIILSLRAYYGGSEEAHSLRCRAAAAFLVFTSKRPKTKDQEALKQRRAHLFQPDSRLWQAVALVHPLAFALAALVSASLLVGFLWPNLGIVLGAFGEYGSLVEEASSRPFYAWGASYLFAALCLLTILTQLPALAILSRHGRSIVLWIGIRSILLMVVFALAALAAHALFVDPYFESGLVHGIGYGFLAALALSGLVIPAFYYRERLYSEAVTLVENHRYGRFWAQTLEISNHFPQPKGQPVGYVFLNTLSDVYTIGSVLLVLCRLRQLGWATIVVDRWPSTPEKTGDPSVDCFFSCKMGQQEIFNYDWRIDWENKVVEAGGINVYHPIWEGLSSHFGRYRISLKDEQVEEIFRAILLIADSALLQAQRIYNTVAGNGKPVRIVGGSGQFVPNAVFNIFCREIGKDRDMHFVWLQQGYQTYYKDKATLSDRISIENMTRKWPFSNPYLAHRDDFEAWVAKGQDVAAIVAEAEQWVGTKRATTRSDLVPRARETLDRIESCRAAGGKVVCIFGKVVFDLTTPWEGGPAHSGMDDWLNHSIEAARGAEDVLLLIKPHPYEVRSDIAGLVQKSFTDLIETKLPDNVIVLGHDWFNLHSLIPRLDLGILWNGTSGLELGLKGVPVLMCADWGPIDYPIGFAAPKDRPDYERIIRDPGSVSMPEDYAEKCALLLKFIASDEVMIPYDYCARPLTNKPFGPPIWHMDQVREFIAKGDPFVDFAARKIY